MCKLRYYLFLSLLIGACADINKKDTGRQADRIAIPAYTLQADYVFPADTGYTGQLLSTGTFHADEVPENAENEKWTGLFTANGSYYLRQTVITTRRVPDPIGEENENDSTGWEVSTDNADSSLILFTGLQVDNRREIEEISNLSGKQLFPGDTVRFNYKGIKYVLFATGHKTPEENDPRALIVSDYRLYLHAEKNGLVKTEVLVAQPGFDDNMTTILFAGDIDEDGFVDFLIDTSSHYNMEAPALYLSGPAGKDRLLKIIGCHVRVGC